MEALDYINIINFSMFYNILGCLINDLYILEKQRIEKEDNQSKLNIKNVIEDNDVSNEDKTELLSLLNINSLNRCYILYFIFKKRGTFYTSYDLDNENEEAFNAYDEYVFWKNNFDNGLEFNIDETLYDTPQAHINFISWLYYSGLYDYLMENLDIKKQVLDEMHSKKLLSGNLFLKYILFTNEYEELNPNINDIENYSDSDKLSTASESESDSKTDSESDSDGDSDGKTDDEDNCVGYSTMIGDIDKYRFLYSLTQSTKKILSRIYNDTKTIIKEEYQNIFQSHLS